MKFLIDNQLPVDLAIFIRKRGFDCEHVLEIGLAEASDAEICRYATSNRGIIVSKDADFLHLVHGPKVLSQLLWVRLGNCRTSALLEVFDRAWARLEASLQAGERVIEIR